MTDIKPCPFCGEIPELISDGEHVICRRGCIPNTAYHLNNWNVRKGEPKRVCANCSNHRRIQYGFGSDIEHSYACNYHKASVYADDLACEHWEGMD